MEFLRSWYVPKANGIDHPSVMDTVESLTGEVLISIRPLNMDAAKEPDEALPPA